MKLAIILARGGSKRIPRKNYSLFCGKPMIYWAIKAANESKYIDDIFVSSDSEKILNISTELKAKIIKRPKSQKTLSLHTFRRV